MTNPNKPINLSVHETSDPSLFSSDPNKESYNDLDDSSRDQESYKDLGDSNHDDENVDVPNPELSNASDENLANSQITAANLSAG